MKNFKALSVHYILSKKYCPHCKSLKQNNGLPINQRVSKKEFYSIE